MNYHLHKVESTDCQKLIFTWGFWFRHVRGQYSIHSSQYIMPDSISFFIQTWTAHSGLSQNLAINKKSTIFTQLLWNWNSVKISTHELTKLPEYQLDWAKIVDFLLIANFWARPEWAVHVYKLRILFETFHSSCWMKFCSFASMLHAEGFNQSTIIPIVHNPDGQVSLLIAP